MGSKYLDTRWDFRSADTKQYTHCFHNYPAMMIPQIAGGLIDKYSKKAKLLFDPYCGSGTSLVESCLRGIDSIGTDLNPLARFMSKVKTTNLDLKKLDKHIKEYSDISFKHSFGIPLEKNYEIPKFKNIDFWFNKEVQKKLAFIKNFMGKIEDTDIRDLFTIPFSETVRECSWTRNGEFKLYRMPENKREIFDPDVFAIMERKLLKVYKGIKEFFKDKRGNAKVLIYDFNTVDCIPENLIENQSVDIVLTSPPYGDSRTTVAYGQFSRLSSEWLGFANANQVDKLLMGGTRQKSNGQFKCELLINVIDEISKKDDQRVKDVIGFFCDYQKSINKIAPLIRKNGFACYVVGNRRVKGVNLPTDEITKEFFESNGFEHIETIIRNIPNKRMPSKNSPTNEVGVQESTMTKEYIVVMKKIA